MNYPNEPFQFNDDAGARAVIDEYSTKGLRGFVLEECNHNTQALIAAVKEIGWWNAVVVKHVVNELLKTGVLRWRDTRPLADGTQRLSENPSEYELFKASPEQLRAHLKDKRINPTDTTKQYSWQLDLYADRATVLAASIKAVADWALRRRRAGLPDSV